MVKNTYRYVSVDDVYRTSGITSTEINREDVEKHVERAEVFACRLTKNIYYNYNLEDEDITSATNDTLVLSSANWSTNEWSNQYVELTSGTGSGQIRKILSNTDTTMTIDRDWETNPDATSSFSVFYVPKSYNPFKDLTIDGNGKDYMYLDYYPVNVVEELEINDISVTPSSLYLYEEQGKIGLSSTSEYTTFLNTYPKQVSIKYWYGVNSLTDDVKRLVELRAGLSVLSQQMGGTFDVPSTFSLPDLNVSIGQAYINIKGTYDVLKSEYEELKTTIRTYPVFG